MMKHGDVRASIGKRLRRVRFAPNSEDVVHRIAGYHDWAADCWHKRSDYRLMKAESRYICMTYKTTTDYTALLKDEENYCMRGLEHQIFDTAMERRFYRRHVIWKSVLAAQMMRSQYEACCDCKFEMYLSSLLRSTSKAAVHEALERANFDALCAASFLRPSRAGLCAARKPEQNQRDSKTVKPKSDARRRSETKGLSSRQALRSLRDRLAKRGARDPSTMNRLAM